MYTEVHTALFNSLYLKRFFDNVQVMIKSSLEPKYLILLSEIGVKIQ